MLMIIDKIKTLLGNKVRLFFAIFYFVGTIGFLIPQTSYLFSHLTPFALLITLFLLLIYHPEKYDIKTIVVFISIFLFGYLIELLGVNTGLIFGSYTYNYGLGPMLFKTPLMIGVNWLILSYIFDTLTKSIKTHKLIQALIAAIGMTAYDIVIEQVASTLQMWDWKDGIIPIQNYFAWFVIGLIMQLAMKYANINTRNPLSLVIILCHITFFLILILVN